MDKIVKQSGTTLLLAMLIMAGILTVSLATSKLVINEVVQSAQLDKAIVAFYASEAGIERSLYQVRQQGYNASDLHQFTEALDNNSSYELIAEDTEDVLYATIAKDESYQVDLYEPNSLNALDNPIKSVRISWEGAGAWLEVRWNSWTTSGVVENPQGVYISQASSPYIIQLYDSTSYLYRLKIIARQAQAANVTITAYDDINPVANCAPLPVCQVPIPGRVSIKSLGEYPDGSARASRQAILVTMPQRSPLSGLYDYVIYSEEEIVKEN